MAIFQPISGQYLLPVGHHRVPLMVMSYIGTLKAWIYSPIFRVFGVGVWALRVPVLLAGTASVWLLFLLLRRMAGERAALIGCSLLAVDSAYLLTICFDWGPVALQHLLLVGGLYLLLRFYQQGSHVALAGGSLLLGLGLWDKALAVWMLSGIGVAALVVFPRSILVVITKRRLAIAALAFAVGALPLLIYNAASGWPTFGGNFHRDTSDIPGKAHALLYTAQGAGLFGWMFFENWQTPVPHEPRGALETASARISALAGHPRQHLLHFAFLLALLLTPLARRGARRAILFAITAMAVGWFQMAITAGAGGSVHHAILLWPFPQIVVAVSFAAASRRLGRAGIPALAVVTAVLTITGALVTNEHHFVMARYGGAPMWTDAVFRLSDYMKTAAARNVYCVDWGILDTLRVLNHGKLALVAGGDPIDHPQLSPEDRERIRRMIADPRGLFLAHTKEFEFFPTNRKLLEFAASQGYERRPDALIADSWGRPAFDVYHFVAAGRTRRSPGSDLALSSRPLPPVVASGTWLSIPGAGGSPLR